MSQRGKDISKGTLSIIRDAERTWNSCLEACLKFYLTGGF